MFALARLGLGFGYGFVDITAADKVQTENLTKEERGKIKDER